MGTIKKISVAFIFLFHVMQSQTVVYLFPGQGSDERLFAKFKFDSTKYKVVAVVYPVPKKGTTLPHYAKLLSQQIDTSKEYVFIGVSLGGMICTELCETFHPKKTIIISSAKCRSELPFRYRFQKTIPLYKIFPAVMLKWGAQILQPIVEPDRKKEKATFKNMLKGKSPKYYKRTVSMIINWDQKSANASIVHIHGTKDHTIPIRHVKCDAVINKGSHMMTLTRGEEIFPLVLSYIENWF